MMGRKWRRLALTAAAAHSASLRRIFTYCSRLPYFCQKKESWGPPSVQNTISASCISCSKAPVPMHSSSGCATMTRMRLSSASVGFANSISDGYRNRAFRSNQMFVEFDVFLCHSRDGETAQRCFPAGDGINLINMCDGIGHIFHRVDNESGLAVFNDLWQGAGAHGDDGCSTGKSLHAHERTGFGGNAGNQQALRRSE